MAYVSGFRFEKEGEQPVAPGYQSVHLLNESTANKGASVGLTQAVANYVFKDELQRYSAEVIRLAHGFILDGLGVALAGSTDECSRIVQAQFARSAAGTSARCSAPLCRRRRPKPRWPMALPVMRWITMTRSSRLPKKRFMGCLTHPTTPVLAAVLAVGEKQKITGAEFLLAYILGVEVECRIADCDQSAPLSVRVSFHRDHGRTRGGDGGGENSCG